MATSASNFLKYANIDYADIIQQINSKLAADRRFDNFRESAITQTLIEIFAGCVDLVTYYLQRRAEENFFDSAKLRSSVILLSRQLGYVVVRPIPATTKLKIILRGDLNDLVTGPNPQLEEGFKIQIPYHQNFTFEGNSFIIKNTYSYTLTQSDITGMLTSGADYKLELTVDDENDEIVLVQGEIKEKIIEGETNPQVGQKFQNYKIDDTSFSNIYGPEDFSPATTKIWVGNNKSDSNSFSIDRRSLINWESLDGNFVEGAVAKQVCVIRTSIDEGVDVVFGDDRYASLGARTSFDNIYIQYLSTLGSKANKTGVVEKDIEYSGKIYGKTGIDITDRFLFKLNGNIVGGADLEDIESIKYNAPAIYYTLDRLVTQPDYVNYLKSLTSPIDIKNAVAWGEQDELESRKEFSDERMLAIQELFNVIFFTCVGSLYELSVDPHYPRETGLGLDNAVLDYNFDENEFTGQSYFNVYTKNNVVEQLRRYNTTIYYWELLGATSATKTDVAYYTGQYSTGATLVIDYGSDKIDNYPNGIDDQEILMDFTDLTGANVYDLMAEIASKIQEKLRQIVDMRGGSKVVNSNYGSYAFPNISCAYDALINKFKIFTSVSDECYVTGIRYADLSTSAVLPIDLGLSAENVSYVISKINNSVNTEISGKITDVINELNSRGQITVKHIYVSPIIHNFDLIGTVYVNPLFDKNSVKTNVENAIYTWLDLNADFNKPIYKSNIVEIIEGFAGVKYANVNLYPTAISGGPFWDSQNGDSLGILASYESSASYIQTIQNNLESFLTSGYTFEYNNITNYATEIKYFYKYVNERNFFTSFVGNCWGLLAGTPLGTNYDHFIKVMSCVHKDIIQTIRYNLLDSEGNISTEYRNNNFYIGGYSLPMEIVKVKCNLNYVYKG